MIWAELSFLKFHLRLKSRNPSFQQPKQKKTLSGAGRFRGTAESGNLEPTKNLREKRRKKHAEDHSTPSRNPLRLRLDAPGCEARRRFLLEHGGPDHRLHQLRRSHGSVGVVGLESRSPGLAGCRGGWVAGWLGGWVAGWLAGWVGGWLGLALFFGRKPDF